ncbi:MAG: hypothetical protein JXX29_09620 [Deltaproteobacteria bacterium]|nr:hypothetical protein [Deltaproteobacteria bacterium]MBN2671923.1 hypothetical protein [Deltaproteobacteria bacterium]
MKRAVVCLLPIAFAALCVPLHAKESPQSNDAMFIGPMFDSRTINADAEFGFIAWNNTQTPSRFFSRIRVGLLRTRDPFFASADLGVNIGGLRPVAIGIHFGVTHLISGFSVQAFYAMSPDDAASIIGASLGWAVFAAEMQFAPGDDFDRILLFSLRIPFGAIMYGLYRMEHDVQQQLQRNRGSH